MSAGVALVTGGGRGLGRAIANHLGESGWQVAVTGRSPAALEGAGDLELPGDVTSRADVEQAVRRTTTELGPLDLVVANAGTFVTGGPFWETDPEAWWREIEVNLRGVSLLARAAVPGMVARGTGRLVALGSGLGNRPSTFGSAYGVGKTAVHRLIETLALELTGTGVHAFAVSPGRARTDMTTSFPAGFTDAHPDYLEPPDGGWAPVEKLTALLDRLTRGELDALSGRYLQATAEPPAAAEADQGTLRLVPYTPGE